MRPTAGRRIAAVMSTCMCLAAFLVQARSAAAVEYDPVASGTTTLTLAAPFARLLTSEHVSIEARGGAKRVGRKFVLPAASGEFEPLRGTGTVEHEGTLVFVAGSRKVPFRAIVFKAKRAPLYAKVGGGQLKIAGGAKLASKREGFGIVVTASGLKLTAKVATRLDKKLRLGKALAGGQQIGTLSSRVTPVTVHLLLQNRISLALDPGFVEKLNKLFVSVNPIAPAELSGGPTLSFPIGAESVLAPGAGSGLVKAGGGVELLQLGSAQTFWQEPWLEPAAATLTAEADLEPSPPKPGRQVRGPLLSVMSGQANANPLARTISVSGQTVGLTAATAEELNSSFSDGKTTFAAGETIGMLSYVAQGH